MPRPTNRTYIAVLIAFVLLCGVGGYFAANWRGFAAAYYLRRAADPEADWPTVREALNRATRLDRKQVLEFWRRELAELNRNEEPGPAAGPVWAKLEAEKYIVEEGNEVHVLVTFHNPTQETVFLPSKEELFTPSGLHPVAAWAADRRRPKAWAHVYGSGSSRFSEDDSPLGVLAPGAERREPFVLSGMALRPAWTRKTSVLITTPAALSAGLQRFRLCWPVYQGGTLSTNWITVLVLPPADETEPYGTE